MRIFTLLFILCFTIPSKTMFSQCCTVTLETYDSYGDDWNGGFIEVTIDGVSQGTFAASNYGSTFSFNVCDGDVFDLIYTAGSLEGDNSYELINSNGIIFSDGPYPNTGSVFTENNTCSLSPSCVNTSSFGTETAPTDNSPVEISTCQYQTEYNTINSVVAGETYISDLSCGGFITIRSGSYNGSVVASGNVPLSWTAPSNGTYYVHYNTNSSCGTATSCCTSSIQCSSCPTPSIPPQDCEGAIMVCNDNTFNGDAVDYGNVYEINDPVNTECDMNSENQSTWFYVNIGTSGTLEMTIDPANGSDDYDWAIWGPYTSTSAAANCPPIETPLRCNTSANTPLTGMNSTATSDYEYPGTSTYEWSNPINATAGDVYIMMIDNWSASGNPFSLDWGGTADLNCTSVVLPITLMDFSGENNGDHNHLFWSTQTEKDNDYFILEYSPSGVNWSTIDIISGAGTTSMIQNYSTVHRGFESGTNYYRLSQVDFDGDITKHKIISIDNNEDRNLIKRVNSMGQEVTKNYKGLVILYFSDGSIKKILQ